VPALEHPLRGNWTALKGFYAAASMKLYGIIIRIYRRSDLADQVGGGFRARVRDPTPACRSLGWYDGTSCEGIASRFE
jgi:hypothetical protein